METPKACPKLDHIKPKIKKFLFFVRQHDHVHFPMLLVTAVPIVMVSRAVIRVSGRVLSNSDVLVPLVVSQFLRRETMGRWPVQFCCWVSNTLVLITVIFVATEILSHFENLPPVKKLCSVHLYLTK